MYSTDHTHLTRRLADQRSTVVGTVELGYRQALLLGVAVALATIAGGITYLIIGNVWIMAAVALAVGSVPYLAVMPNRRSGVATWRHLADQRLAARGQVVTIGCGGMTAVPRTEVVRGVGGVR